MIERIPELLRPPLRTLIDPAAPPVDEVLPPYRWNPFVRQVVSQRIIGFAWQAMEQGRLPVTEEQREEILELQIGAQTTALRRDVVAAEVSQILTDAGIEHRFIKGMATAALLHPPGVRQTGDIDLLVEPDNLVDAHELLVRGGCSPDTVPFRGPADRQLRRGLTVAHPTGIEIDCHRRFGYSPVWIDAAAAALATPADRADPTSDALPMLAHRFLLAGVIAHLVPPSVRLGTIADLVALLPIREDALADMRSWGIDAYADVAFGRADALLPADKIQPKRAAEGPRAAARRKLVARELDQWFLISHLRLAASRPSTTGRLAWEYVMPSPQVLEVKRRSRRQHARNVGAHLMGHVGRSR